MDKKTMLEGIKLYLFDMDGTLYLGDRLYDFTIELLQQIRRTGGKYLFITNNSSKSVADYVTTKLQPYYWSKSMTYSHPPEQYS